MNAGPTRPRMSRRKFVGLLAGTAAAAVGGYTLSEYTPWLNYEKEADEIWRPLGQDAEVSMQMKELVRYASLAANGHNTQPWKFAVKDGAIEIHPDFTRGLPVVDPSHRELWISLGCALENFVIAARAAGYAPQVTYPDVADAIRVDLTPDTPQGGALFDAIPLRQNVRSEHDGRAINGADLDRVQAVPLEPGVVLQFITDPAGIETVVEYVNQGNLAQYADKAFLDELIYWLRFTKKEALASKDGLYTKCGGNPQLPRWLGASFVSGTKPQQQADADAKKLRSSSGAVVVASESDDKATWVRTGQVYERMALTMTSLNIKSAFLNQPIEIATVRSQFQSAIGLGESMPQLLVRFGYADAMPYALRRPVGEVII